MTDPLQHRRWPWIAGSGTAGLLLGGLVAFGLIDAATPDYALAAASVQNVWSGAARPFLLSPGFGGSAAFLAAAVAFLVARDRLDDDRAARVVARELTEQDARDERWWKLFELLVDDDSIIGASDQGPAMALELKKAAQTQLQRTAALLLVEMYDLEDDVESVDQGGSIIDE